MKTDKSGGGSVLVVEEKADVGAGVAAVLEVFGCHVQHELSADSALDVLKSGATFDLILSDIQMPGTNNGIDLAEKVPSSRPSHRIALMTGYADKLEPPNHPAITTLS